MPTKTNCQKEKGFSFFDPCCFPSTYSVNFARLIRAIGSCWVVHAGVGQRLVRGDGKFFINIVLTEYCGEGDNGVIKMNL